MIKSLKLKINNKTKIWNQMFECLYIFYLLFKVIYFNISTKCKNFCRFCFFRSSRLITIETFNAQRYMRSR